jgi:hypothetical protein
VAGSELSSKRAKLFVTASGLRLDVATAEVLANFELAGVRALLLKGRSVQRWLYPDGEPRPFVDCDLLIAPADLTAAEDVLCSLGYSPDFDDRAMPPWWREHAAAWVRDADGVMVDLHRTLPGVGVKAEVTWAMLSAGTDAVIVAGRSAPSLSLPGRALHVALHAAQHGARSTRPLADLERAIAVADDELWRDAAALAAELDAIDAFTTGLRLTEAGARLATRLQFPQARSVDAQLRAASPPPVALGFEQLARASGFRTRAEIVLRKLIPPPSFIRHWDPSANDSRIRLLRAYLRRPLWIARHAPGGLAAWLAARRSVRLKR